VREFEEKQRRFKQQEAAQAADVLPPPSPTPQNKYAHIQPTPNLAPFERLEELECLASSEYERNHYISLLSEKDQRGLKNAIDARETSRIRYERQLQREQLLQEQQQ
jgi:hypothetical protein